MTFVAVADLALTPKRRCALRNRFWSSTARSFAIAMLLASGWLDEARILGRRRQRNNGLTERVREGDVTL